MLQSFWQILGDGGDEFAYCCDEFGEDECGWFLLEEDYEWGCVVDFVNYRRGSRTVSRLDIEKQG